MSRRAKLPGAAELFRVTGQSVGSEASQSGLAEPGGGGFAEPMTVERDRAAPRAETGTRRAVRSVPPLHAADPLFVDDEPSARTDAGSPAREDTLPSEHALSPAAALPQVRSGRSASRRPPRAQPDRRPTGRERHEEKITVYVSSDELLDLEGARLTLRGEHGLAVDRGRIVREAVAVVLADLDATGEESVLVRRLRG